MQQRLQLGTGGWMDVGMGEIASKSDELLVAFFFIAPLIGLILHRAMFLHHESPVRRPPLSPALPDTLRQLIDGCWHQDATKRPSMKQASRVMMALHRLLLNRPILLHNSCPFLSRFPHVTGR